MRAALVGLVLLIVPAMWHGGVLAAPGLVAPAGLGLGGAHAALARDVDAPLVNPANLALEGNARLAIQIASLGGRFGASGLTLAAVERYSGATLSEEDKAAILAGIPGDGLGVSLLGQIGSAGVSWRGFALTTESVALADGAVPRDLVELALEGNDLGRAYSLAGTRGTAAAMSAVTGSAARRLAVPGFRELAAGVSLRYLRGWAYADVARAEGGVATTLEGIDGTAELATRAARRGSGWGFDLGVAGRPAARLAVGFAVQNLGARVRWSDAKETVTTFAVDSLVVAEMGASADGAGAIDSDSVTRAIDDFELRLPATARLGAAWEHGRLVLASDASWGAGGDGRVKTPLELAFGAEWRRLPRLPLRAGLALGPAIAPRIALGLGADLGAARLDLAVSSEGGLHFGSDEGFGAALGIGLRFR